MDFFATREYEMVKKMQTTRGGGDEYEMVQEMRNMRWGYEMRW